ncbi:MAG: helix-turn-helix domain-containing protein [Phycisphaerales bacterium]|nr:helix-turn-helix domain-containing protein [Phycisphaerales bacterium]
MKGTSKRQEYTTQETLRFFPAEAFYALSAMSERALAYSEEPLKHRTLVIYEAAGLSGDFGTYLRSLLSEGCIRYETVEKTPQGMRSRLIQREGPTNLIITTTAVKLHPENETRLFSLPVTDTPAQTAAVMERIAAGRAYQVDYLPWLAFQEWLAIGERRLVVSFAEDLARSIPPVAVRLRRDFGSLLSLVKAHALLHQGTRERDAQGQIVATIADYAAVRELICDLIAEGIDSTVPPAIRETVSAIAQMINGTDLEVTVTEVARALRLDKAAASRRCRAALDAGYVINREDRRGRPFRLVLGEPMPADLEILPRPEALHGCSVDGESHPSPPLMPVSALIRRMSATLAAIPLGGWPGSSSRTCGRCHPPVGEAEDLRRCGMSESSTPKLALTVEETAEALGVSARTVERLIASGELRSRKIGRRRVIAMAELQRFLVWR